MLVAIEGVDLTGKSTLAAELRETWGASVTHAGPPECGSLAEYEDAIALYDPLSGENVVLDRWHVGEYVWPEIFRRPTDMVDPAVRRHVEMFMCSRGCVIVYATRDYGELHAALSLSDEPLRPTSLALALQRFDEALNDGHNRGFVFEHDHEHRHLTAIDLGFVCGQADDDVRPLHGTTSDWIGHPDPNWVVAVDGMTDGIVGRQGAGLHPAVAQILRAMPEQAWRGFAIVDVAGMSDMALAEFARLADPYGWVALGDSARERVLEVAAPSVCFSPGYAVLKQRDLAEALEGWSLAR